MKHRLKQFFKENRKFCEPKLKTLKKMPRISILKCFLCQLNCLLQWYNFYCKYQKLSKLHSRFLETIPLSFYMIFRYWFSRRSCFAGDLGSHRYGTFFELTTHRCSVAYLLFLFSCSQNVVRHLDVICQTFWKLISSLDSGVFILYHYSLACCFLIHWDNRLWSNLTLTYFLEDTFVINEVC